MIVCPAVPRSRLTPALAVLAACVTTRPAPPPPTTPEELRARAVERARAEARALLRTQAELYWRNWVFGEEVDIAATYRGREWLFSPETLASVEDARAAATGDEQRALHYFKLFLVGERVAMAVAETVDRISALQADATVTIEGAEVRWRDLEARLANEPDYVKRGAIAAAELPVLARLNPLFEQKESRTRALVADAGYGSYLDLAAELRMAKPAALVEWSMSFLAETRDAYLAAMEDAVQRELGIPLERMRRADVPRLFRGARVDARFPAEGALAAARATLRGLGIDLDAQKNIQIHKDALPRKNPRSVALALEVPGDVRLSVKPAGGVEDWRALLHELGHAEHFAHTARPEFEFQQLGNSTVTEAYAFLLEGLLEEPEWVRAHTGLAGAELQQFIRSEAAKKLYRVRRYAGRLGFEASWRTGGENAKDLYRTTLSYAYGFALSEADAERHLLDVDDFLLSADYFRAWFLAAQIAEALGQEHGAEWWRAPAAGAELQALWREGTRLTPDEAAQALGAPALDPAALARRIERGLTFNAP
jgi:hypothetical protein